MYVPTLMNWKRYPQWDSEEVGLFRHKEDSGIQSSLQIITEGPDS